MEKAGFTLSGGLLWGCGLNEDVVGVMVCDGTNVILMFKKT
jgi:hypothetical protein